MWTLDRDVRLRYVQEMTRLSAWYVWQLRNLGEIGQEDISKALCTRVNLYRLTDLWDGRDGGANGVEDPRWLALVEQMAEWVRTTSAGQTGALEERVLALLQPWLEARVPKDVGPPPVRPFECWTYELGWAGLADRPGRLGRLRNFAHVQARVRQVLGLRPAPARDAVLHIMNAMAPRSLFEDVPRLAGTLRALIAEVRGKHPEVHELWCNTWLNEHPRFREVMPEVWFRSGTVSPPGNYRNWWGQFARRDGSFNEKLGQQFRASGGVFPFRAMLCHAPLEQIDRHLAQRFR